MRTKEGAAEPRGKERRGKREDEVQFQALWSVKAGERGPLMYLVYLERNEESAKSSGMPVTAAHQPRGMHEMASRGRVSASMR